MGLWGRVKKAAKSATQFVKRVPQQVNWKRVGLGVATLGFNESVNAVKGSMNYMGDVLSPDITVDIPPDSPLAPPSAAGQSLDLAPNRKRVRASRSTLKINKTSSAPATAVGVNFPK